MGNRKDKLILTLVIIEQRGKVLLGMKKRGFGTGRWNGFGGKVKPLESIEEGAKRELHEEAGIMVNQLEKVGILDFNWRDEAKIMQVHIFKAASYQGEPVESREMRPQWFNEKEIPYRDMWPDDKYWLPLVLKGEKFRGKFRLGEKDAIIEHELVEVKNKL